MKTAIEIIDQAIKESQKTCIAFSGGSDSILLLDIVFRHTDHRPVVIFADSQMEYPGTEGFCRKVCKKYGVSLQVAKADRTPREQWDRQGWPMLGKLAARKWMQRHKQNPLGFKLDVSSCCQNMKISPARKLAKQLGCDLQLTGTKGATDDMLRGLRTIKDGATHYVKSAKMTICNPLIGWTDTMVRRYRDKHNLPMHPMKKQGAITIGCVCCGGGAQYTNSGFRVLRKVWPEGWRQYIIEYGMGEIILAIKYDQHIKKIREAITNLGGIEAVAKERPWVFDFTTISPLQGYQK